MKLLLTLGCLVLFQILTITCRDEKVFSLFSVVQFQNEACRSTMALPDSARGNRNGTCFTSSECTSRGGSAQGNCAAGFGVCCIFVVNDDTGTVNENCTYLQNPGYPSSFNGSQPVRYTVSKSSDDVCYLRLDFEVFNTQGVPVAASLEAPTAAGALYACLDQLQITSPSSQNIPVICGQNDGQHIYVDLGAQAGNTATINFNFGAGNADRTWDIKVTQVKCCTEAAPPTGCLQYHTGLTGRLTTFDFDSNNVHLPNQRYSVCIRQEAGYCCVQYRVCPDTDSVDDGFSLDNQGGSANAMVDSICQSKDYIGISDSAADCSQANNLNLATDQRYCGKYFNNFMSTMASAAVCDCTAPFIVDIFTNALPDVGTMNTGTGVARGACLQWSLIECSG